MDLKKIFRLVPEVGKPEEKKVGFNTKLKWTIIILVAFFVLANIPLFGLSSNALQRFESLAILLGTQFGSIISLGISPIVMGSIILQLLWGSGILNIDVKTSEGKKYFQGIQKLVVIFFIVFESIVYVLMRGLEAAPGFTWLVILQLMLGGFAIYFMNEVSEKWGFGSGVSLFIGAGVSWRLFTQAFQFINQQGRNCLANFEQTNCPGQFFLLIQSVVGQLPIEFWSALATILATIAIFLAVVWAQSLKVEVPLSMGRMRGFGMKYPLSFFYASVIPVILVAALMANIQVIGGLVENWVGHPTFLGSFDSSGQATSGLAFWMSSTNLLDLAIRGALLPRFILQGITHIITFTILASVFSVFWVKTSGMDAKSKAKELSSQGLQIAGFRQDIRVLESVLDRYIMPLTVMGGAAIGILAATTDLLGALVSGTAMLLVIMVFYQFYQNIAKQHMTDMNPAMRKFMGK